ncbi:MAG: NAD(P)-binding domain-containing protein, partial [Pseudomonadota bacterium]
MSKIGFMGLGLMGGAMVGRLQDQGHDLCVLANRDRTHVDKAIARGASEASTAKELAEASEIVMLCMGTSEQVEGRMRGPEGVIAGLQPGAIVIDFGTSLPASTKALAEEVAAAG